MLLHTPDKSRWFLVPDEVSLPDGDLSVITFTREPRTVDEAVIVAFEVEPHEAREWLDERFRASFARAGDAFGRLATQVRLAARARGRDVPDVSGARVSAEELLGMSPAELYMDPSRGREAVDKVFAWASERLRPKGVPAGQRPEPRELLQSLGAGLKAAAERIEARRRGAEAHHRGAEAHHRGAEAHHRGAEAHHRGAGGHRTTHGQPGPAAQGQPSDEPRPARRKLLRIGFFTELRHGDRDGPSLSAARRDEPQPHEAEILSYLRGAPVLIASPGPVRDVLDPDSDYIGTPSVHTDGVWCWPGDLAGYVERYHLALPRPFLEHLLQRGWVIGEPELDTVRL